MVHVLQAVMSPGLTGGPPAAPGTCPKHAHAPALWLLLAAGSMAQTIRAVHADFDWNLLQASGGDKAMQKVATNLRVMVAELPPLEGTTQPRSLEVWLPKRVNKEWKAE